MKKLFTLLTAGVFLTAGSVNAQDVIFSHNDDDVIVSGSGVSCGDNETGLTSDNEFARWFDVSDYGVTGDFEIYQVDFGVETVELGTMPMTVTIYESDFDFPFGDLTIKGSQQIDIADLDNEIVETPFDTPVELAGNTDAIAVSISQEAGLARFFPGGTMPGTFFDTSWLRSEGCGLTDFTDVTTLGAFDTANWYIVALANYKEMGTIEFGSSQMMGIYPNPATDIINIALRNGADVESVEIINLAGQNVIQAKAVDNVNISFLTPGVYVVKVIDKEGVTHFTKVVKK